ncbi:MAG: transposase [Nitrospirae bacterium]|nr:transposase [Nitrospirota bacterium]
MDNHVHLLMETPKAPVLRIMQMLNFTYTQYFNKKYGKVGHLFQGRYKSYLCDKDAYLLALIRYIHMNPVRAGIVKNIDAYRWSSHRDYVAGGSGLVTTTQVLRLFSGTLQTARKLYGDFMGEEAASDKKGIYQVVDQQIVGNDEFIEAVERRLKRSAQPLRKISMERLIRMVEEETGIDKATIVSRRRSKALRITRSVLVAVAREMGYTMTELTGLLKRDISILSKLSKNATEDECQALHERIRMLNAQKKA